MPELLPIASPSPSPPAALVAMGVGVAAPGFAQAFDAAADPPPLGLAAVASDPERQPFADDGKDAPDAHGFDLAVMACFLPPPPVPTAVAPASPATFATVPDTSRPSPATALPPPAAPLGGVPLPADRVETRPATEPHPPVADPQPSAAASDVLPGIGPPPVAVAVPVPPAAPVAVQASEGIVAPTPRRDAVRATPAADAPQPPVSTIRLPDPVPQPARVVFAAAIAAADGWRDRTLRHGASDPAAPSPFAPVTTEPRAVAAPSATRDAPLDLGSETGAQVVIDRIATLRDAAGDSADARDTRIRLIPDALGAVDIAVRRDGDAVRVHFTAAQDATRALLIDAQPRLTELAAARGLRIAEAGVSGGTLSSETGDRNAAPSPPPRGRPAPMIVTAAATAPEPTDIRLA